MSTLAPGDMHNDHQDDPWMRKAVSESNRLARHWVGRYVENASDQQTDAERPQTPRQALLWLTSQYTPVTDDDHKAMFILTRFINGNGDWSEVGYQQHQRMQRLAEAEARVMAHDRVRYEEGVVVMDQQPRSDIAQQFIDNARGE